MASTDLDDSLGPEFDMSFEREVKFLEVGNTSLDFPIQKDAHGLTPDPLGDVIDWLGYADLSDDIGTKESGSRSRPVGGAVGNDPATREAFAKATSSSAPGNSHQGGATSSGAVGNDPATREAFAKATSSSAPGNSHQGGATSSGDTGEPPIFTGRPKVLGSQRSLTGYCGIGKETNGRSQSGLEPEEEEWDARQQQTGAAGRLVVYEEGERPKADFMLRGGNGRRIMVSAVTEGGKAAQAGVKAGDVLVSIDGKKDFKEMSADHVHASLKGPVMLVFLGFVGKLQAEVRLNYKQKVCGLSSQHQVVFGRPDAPVQARSLVSRALSKAQTASPFAPRYVSRNALMGDHAQVPRSLTPSVTPFSDRLDSRFTPTPELIPGKPFRFATNGSQVGIGFSKEEEDKNRCGAPDWWGGTACPRTRS
mmetsp:Transcript_177692/g.432331  ORF Transcript_177692/g.432331 Transcript_177692/m.432331 type:complete len:421 (-) Transcript_177692:97-1359(-)